MLVVAGGSDLVFARGASSTHASTMRDQPSRSALWSGSYTSARASSNDEPATAVSETQSLPGRGPSHRRRNVPDLFRGASSCPKHRLAALPAREGRSGKPHIPARSDMSRTTVEDAAMWRSPPTSNRCAVAQQVLKIPGGGLATLVHPRRGPPGLIPSGQLIAR
ncbi:hypothetical protein B0H17DRAFT_1217251 [Mycena rosella]|uniref:Uncharacterized protein n=1 Tax=Mycena rosella TaxID=1033263 RepID=A0AAD7C0K7_MYCRO|nr:hypothetical protein B0H17DRAFT_1217251 [Mycena rosella]